MTKSVKTEIDDIVEKDSLIPRRLRHVATATIFAGGGEGVPSLSSEGETPGIRPG